MSVLTVGSGQQYATLAAAVAASHDGDTIYVNAGTYLNDFAVINTKISIVGVGGMAHFVFDGSVPIPNGKAILVTRTDVSLDHIEFSGAAVPDGNGAGIRYEGGNLTITNCYFHNNQEGLLAAASAGGSITIDHSEFAANGKGDGYTHNIYIGKIATFSITNSYIHDAVVGHEIKSRAETTIVLDNRIIDGNSTASYSIDLPYGGVAIIENNFIQQGPNSLNSVIINYGSATLAPYVNSQLLINGNTIINQKTAPSVMGVYNRVSIVAQITGNDFYGLTAAKIATGPNVQSGNTMLGALPAIDTSHPWVASPWDDLFSGGAGDDVLVGSSGRDLLVGGAGSDVFQIVAGGGSDTIADFLPGSGLGDVVRLDGYGFADFAAVRASMTQNGTDTLLDLGNGDTLTFTQLDVASFVADDFDIVVTDGAGVTITGTIGANIIDEAHTPSGQPYPTGGGDIIYGLSGSDVISGLNGNDMLDGGQGADQLSGGPGADSILGRSGDDWIDGGEGDDSLSGGGEQDTITGGAGDDTISGDSGNDGLLGGDGDDILSGGLGADTLTGGSGSDQLTGGGGADTFIFGPGDVVAAAPFDTIADFKHAQGDKIDLTAIDAVQGGLDDAFTFIGSAAFSGAAGQLHYVASAGSLTIEGDTDGDGVADFAISVLGLASLAQGEFQL